MPRFRRARGYVWYRSLVAARIALDAPRAPNAAIGARLYESHYLTAAAPEGGRAVWLRYTSSKEAGQSPRGMLWFTVFDGAATPLRRRTATPGALVTPPSGAWAEIDGAVIAPGRAQGALEDCRWALTWTGGSTALAYLPSERLYDRRLPRSGGAALVPSATFSGHLEAGAESIDLNGWRGMIGHNWGSDHADRWIWVHVTGLGRRDPEGWLDMVLARMRLGPLLSPWLPAGALVLDGRVRRISAGPGARGLRVELGAETLEVSLPHMPGGGLALATNSPAVSTVRWDYAGPGGGGREVRNCSISSARMTVGGAPAFELGGTVAVEIGA